MKKIVTYGTFDMFHIGHLNLIKRCKELGNHLTVFISSDEFNELKGKRSIISFEDRAAIVSSLRYVDEVKKEESWDQKVTDIIENNIDLFVMGADWKGKFDYLKKHCEVIYLDRTENISSTLLKEKLGLV